MDNHKLKTRTRPGAYIIESQGLELTYRFTNPSDMRKLKRLRDEINAAVASVAVQS